MTAPQGPSHLTGTMERVIGTLLRAGVILAAAVVALGAAIYLARNGSSAPQLHAFRGEPSDLCTLPGIIDSAARLSGRGVIQLGLLLLIATPVMRVAVAGVAFLLQRDWVYVGVSFVVLSLLMYSLVVGSI